MSAASIPANRAVVAPIPGALTALKESLRRARSENAQRWTPSVNPLMAMRRLARDVDGVLKDLWQDWGIPGAALVAVGGYGRGALAPYSDVDLLILMPEGYTEESIKTAAERLVTAFWDIGLDAGHSIRSVSECIAQAQTDFTIASALLESRWICGPRGLHQQLEKAWYESVNVKDFAQGKLLEMQQRHGRHQDYPTA